MEVDAHSIESPLPVRSGKLCFFWKSWLLLPHFARAAQHKAGHDQTLSFTFHLHHSGCAAALTMGTLMLTCCSSPYSRCGETSRVAEEGYTKTSLSKEVKKVIPRKIALPSLGCSKLRR
jgi:hypothetical protein